jgi:hypothetical protein
MRREIRKGREQVVGSSEIGDQAAQKEEIIR